MKRNKLEKLRRELEGLRASPQKASTLESFAGRLGRKQVKRGKEPTWESELPNVFPVAIPHHSKDIPRGTVNSILNQFESELDAWELKLSSNGHDNGGGSGSDDDE